MTGKKASVEEKYFSIKKMLDKNLERKRFVEVAIKTQREELKEIEVLLEKMQTTPLFLSHR